MASTAECGEGVGGQSRFVGLPGGVRLPANAFRLHLSFALAPFKDGRQEPPVAPPSESALSQWWVRMAEEAAAPLDERPRSPSHESAFSSWRRSPLRGVFEKTLFSSLRAKDGWAVEWHSLLSSLELGVRVFLSSDPRYCRGLTFAARTFSLKCFSKLLLALLHDALVFALSGAAERTSLDELAEEQAGSADVSCATCASSCLDRDRAKDSSKLSRQRRAAGRASHVRASGSPTCSARPETDNAFLERSSGVASVSDCCSSSLSSDGRRGWIMSDALSSTPRSSVSAASLSPSASSTTPPSASCVGKRAKKPRTLSGTSAEKARLPPRRQTVDIICASASAAAAERRLSHQNDGTPRRAPGQQQPTQQGMSCVLSGGANEEARVVVASPSSSSGCPSSSQMVGFSVSLSGSTCSCCCQSRLCATRCACAAGECGSALCAKGGTSWNRATVAASLASVACGFSLQHPQRLCERTPLCSARSKYRWWLRDRPYNPVQIALLSRVRRLLPDSLLLDLAQFLALAIRLRRCRGPTLRSAKAKLAQELAAALDRHSLPAPSTAPASASASANNAAPATNAALNQQQHSHSPTSRALDAEPDSTKNQNHNNSNNNNNIIINNNNFNNHSSNNNKQQQTAEAPSSSSGGGGGGGANQKSPSCPAAFFSFLRSAALDFLCAVLHLGCYHMEYRRCCVLRCRDVAVAVGSLAGSVETDEAHSLKGVNINSASSKCVSCGGSLEEKSRPSSNTSAVCQGGCDSAEGSDASWSEGEEEKNAKTNLRAATSTEGEIVKTERSDINEMRDSHGDGGARSDSSDSSGNSDDDDDEEEEDGCDQEAYEGEGLCKVRVCIGLDAHEATAETPSHAGDRGKLSSDADACRRAEDCTPRVSLQEYLVGVVGCQCGCAEEDFELEEETETEGAGSALEDSTASSCDANSDSDFSS